jgi:catechol 2,3-dioxygenase-like lactoylglutathione lyase family enzyme
MLEDLRCAAQVPALDLARARAWYRDALALEPFLDGPGELHYRCGGGSFFTLYESSTAGTSSQTVMVWLTTDLDAEVDALADRGVAFETYDLPDLVTDERGIANLGADRVAWFKDSEGNVLAIGQPGGELIPMLDSPRIETESS